MVLSTDFKKAVYKNGDFSSLCHNSYVSPSTLEMYREVSVLPRSLTDDARVEQIPTSGAREISWDERVDQLVNQGIAGSLNTFQQLLDTIEHKRRR